MFEGRRHFVGVASIGPEEEEAVEEGSHIADALWEGGWVDAQNATLSLSTKQVW